MQWLFSPLPCAGYVERLFFRIRLFQSVSDANERMMFSYAEMAHEWIQKEALYELGVGESTADDWEADGLVIVE